MQESPCDVVRIPLAPGLFVYIDASDWFRVCSHKWRPLYGKNQTYAITTKRDGCGNKSFVLMHRLLLDAPEGIEVDHADGDGLNNRRYNIRLATHAQNAFNRRKQDGHTSRFKGVSASPYGGWCACIEKGGSAISLGKYETEEAAARQYDRAARLMFGKFAKTNQVLGLL